jgi:hypothetical protein
MFHYHDLIMLEVPSQLGDDIGLVSSHSTNQVLEKYYLDPKVLTAAEISALNVRVFGKK